LHRKDGHYSERNEHQQRSHDDQLDADSNVLQHSAPPHSGLAFAGQYVCWHYHHKYRANCLDLSFQRFLMEKWGNSSKNVTKWHLLFVLFRNSKKEMEHIVPIVER
jgi:hypothetical protein